MTLLWGKIFVISQYFNMFKYFVIQYQAEYEETINQVQITIQTYFVKIADRVYKLKTLMCLGTVQLLHKQILADLLISK